MLFQKIAFDRLFPVTLTGMGLLTETSFGFESGGKRYFDVTVPGKPRLEQEMTVIALLEKPNVWHSGGLLGWIDCGNGTLVCASPGKLFGIALLNTYFASMFPLRAYSVFSDSGNADRIAFFVAALFGAFALHCLYLSVKALLVRRALVAVRAFSKSGNPMSAADNAAKNGASPQSGSHTSHPH